MWLIFGYVLTAAVFYFIGFWIQKLLKTSRLKKAEELAQKIIADAKKESEHRKSTADLELRAEWSKRRSDFEKEIRTRRTEIERREQVLDNREANLERKVDLITRKEGELAGKEADLLEKDKAITVKNEQLDNLILEENRKLEKIAGMTQEEAKRQLSQNLEKEVKDKAKEFIKEETEKARAEAEREAKKIIATAIERCATGYVLESTVCTMTLPSDEIKGRLIGREGRNIRSFETQTGVDLLVDDTPESVSISSLDPVRREIAKISLERLIADGRVHPTRIEEIVEQVKKEMPEIIRTAGENMALELKISGLHPEIIKLLGQLRYRTSYGQNVLDHSKEVSHLAFLMATELGLPEDIARRAGLLHDIGKAVSHEYEGTHQKIGGELARRYGESEIVANAIEAHHKDIEPASPIAVLVQAADAMSGARPGARRETFEAYIERLEKLENIVSSFDGVQKAYAIQAGREVRVIVEPEKVTDETATELATSIAHKIEKGMKYPGEIKVTVIRETRAIARAK
ncbi:ribonuclease Y [candidate division WOR-3 bacterium]|nr:ribonuclease Y [candidate division WOR-3 bacterium]